MPFSDASFDPETLDAMSRALEAAWQEVQLMALPGVPDEIRMSMATVIIAAAGNGEHNPERLKLIALQVLIGRRSA